MRRLNELALFAGGGGGLLASYLLGWKTIAAVEIDPYCRKILLQRQRDQILEPFPIWDDIRTFNPLPFKGCIDVVSGGFPCQDISAAGKGKGLSGERSGLVFEMLRVVETIQPELVFAENSPLLRSRGLNVILREFNRMGYHACWGVLGAGDLGAPHKRKRMWIVAQLANSNRSELREQPGRGCREDGQSETFFAVDGESKQLANPPGKRRGSGRTWGVTGKDQRYKRLPGDPNPNGKRLQRRIRSELQKCPGQLLAGEACTHDVKHSTNWVIEPELGRVADGVAYRVDRIKTLGNGQVPIVACVAWNILSEMLNEKRSTIPLF